MFNGTKRALSSDVDQAIYGKRTQAQKKHNTQESKRPALSQQVTTRLQETDKTAKQRQT